MSSDTFDPEDEINRDPMNWREGEGVSLTLRKASGDPRSFKEKLKTKIDEKRKVHESSS